MYVWQAIRESWKLFKNWMLLIHFDACRLLFQLFFGEFGQSRTIHDDVIKFVNSNILIMDQISTLFNSSKKLWAHSFGFHFLQQTQQMQRLQNNFHFFHAFVAKVACNKHPTSWVSRFMQKMQKMQRKLSFYYYLPLIAIFHSFGLHFLQHLQRFWLFGLATDQPLCLFTSK